VVGQRIDFAEKIGDMFARMREKAAARDKSVSATGERAAELERGVTALPHPHGPYVAARSPSYS
jgi:hypothetical protein